MLRDHALSKAPMNHLQFKTLSNHPHLRHLLVEGECIGARATDGTCLLLFQKGKTYSEVIFTHDNDEVLGTRTFRNLSNLQPYL